MSRISIVLMLVALVTALFSCGENEIVQADGDSDQAEAVENEESENSDGDMDLDEAESEMLLEEELEEEIEKETEKLSVFGNPLDGKLYASAGYVTITPTETTHPCTMLLGGTGQNRRATGVHDDLEARVVLLDQGGDYAVLVSLDLVGMQIADVDRVWDKLEDYGIAREKVVLSSTHTHAGPDSMGVWGEDYNVSGRCPEYMLFVVDSVVEKVNALAQSMVPVTMHVAKAEINEPDSNYPDLLRDTRRPYVKNNNFVVAQLKSFDESTVATIINWHCHPETLIDSSEYSADFPRWTRKKVEDELGGTCIYFSGTVGGLMTNLGVEVPERDQDGTPVLVEGKQAFVAEDNEKKGWSLGYVIGEYALKALEDAEEIGGNLTVDTRIVKLPFENMVFVLAFQMGVLEEYDETIKDDKEFCGFFGCVPQPVTHLSFGKFHVITLPGELLPEVSVGREALAYDFGTEWGIHDFPQITGYRASLPEGHYLMEFGLANNEIGYMIPQSDFHPNDHADYYEEYFSISEKTIEEISTNIKEMLAE